MFRRRPIFIARRPLVMRRRILRRGCFPFFALGIGILAALLALPRP